MRKTGMKLALLGAFAAAALLTGCNDYGRSWAQNSQQEDYYPQEQSTHVTQRRGSNIGFPRHMPPTPGDREPLGTGGSGVASDSNQGKALTPDQLQEDPRQRGLWLQRDERVPFPPARFQAMAAMDLGTGKPLKAAPNGAWIQGTHGVELGSGIARSVAPSSGSYQPQEPMQGKQGLPDEPASEAGQPSPNGQKGQPSVSGNPKH